MCFRSKFGLSRVEDKVALANLQANIVSTLQAGCFGMSYLLIINRF